MKIYDSKQHKVGDVDQYGTVSNNDGRKVGSVSEDGTVIDNDDRKVGAVDMSEDDTIHFAGGAALLLLLTA